ncbi:phosphatidylinositol-specific phospholipase C [Bacillus sp. GMa5/2]
MIKKLAFVIPLVSMLSLGAIAPITSFAEGTNGFSDQPTTSANHSNWMAPLANDSSLSELSIPGTHDSLSFYGDTIFHQRVSQTQSMPLDTQLKAGIRYVDIRLKPINNKLDVYHGSQYQHTNFDTVMDTTINFLKSNPSEVILMRVKDESEGTEKNKELFKTIFANYWNKSEYNTYFSKSHTTKPKLGDVRGKIVILQDFESSDSYGMPYQSLDIQDEYTVVNSDKFFAIERQLLKANKDTSKIYLNHFSTNGITDFGTFLHDELTPKGQAETLNTQFWMYMQLPKGYFQKDGNAMPQEQIMHTGIIVMDFPSSGGVSTMQDSQNILMKQGIIDLIISKNKAEVLVEDIDI